MPGQNVSVPVEIACAGCTVRSLKARGLPAGLKLAKDRKTGAYAISGAPKRASAKPFDVQLTLQVKPENAAEKAPPRVKSYALSVLPLPDWSIGTFSGIVWVGDRRCTVTVKAKASGAVSGSVMDGRKKFPFASAYGRGASADGLTLKVEPKRLDGAIRLDVFKAGLGPADVGAMTNAANEAFLVQEPWKTKPFKGLLRKYASPDRTLRWTPAGTFTYAAPTGGQAAGDVQGHAAADRVGRRHGPPGRLCARRDDGDAPRHPHRRHRSEGARMDGEAPCERRVDEIRRGVT